MIKRIERWLARIFRQELAAATTEIAALRVELANLHAEMKEHTVNTAKDVQAHTESIAEAIKTHVAEVSAELHARVAEDAKTILKFQQTARLGCSYCGQLTRTYTIDPITKKIKCADCQKKGVD